MMRPIFVRTPLPLLLLLALPATAQNTHRTPGTVISWGSQVIPHVTPGTRFTKIAAGFSHSLGLTSDGTVVAWGSGRSGESTVPDGLSGVVAIAAGLRQSLALKSDGTVVTWGTNIYGQSTTVPDGFSGVVAIAAGRSHILALKADGTVVAWGQNHYGEGTVPDGLTGVVAIGVGGGHSLALIANAPAIVVQAGGDNVLLSWPLWAQGFALQSTLNLTEENSWTTVITVPVVEGARNRVTDPISGAVKFYRLKK